MSHLSQEPRILHRPRLLIRAARMGLDDYSRPRDLRRLLKTADLPPPSRALDQLMEVEAQLEALRTDGNGNYSVIRHVEVMIALMAEIQLLPGRVPTARAVG